MNWRQLKGAIRLQWSRLTGDYAGVVAALRQRSADRIRAENKPARSTS